MTYHWKTATLADVCIRIGDGSHYSPQSVEEGLPMASVKDMTPFGINLYSCRKISSDDFEKLVRQGCQPKVGDVLISKDGATALDTVCEVKKPLKAVLLSSIAILRPDRDKVTTQYLRYYLDAEPTREYMKAAFTTGAAIPRVVLKDFKRAQVRYPEISLQRKITSILSAYDDLIENNVRRIKILEEMAQTLYREWFVKFRFPSHQKVKMVDSPLGKIPEGWEVLNVENIVKRHPPGKLYEQKTVYAEGTVPVLDQGRSGVIGYHNDSPGVEANEENPVIIFANHTCYQRIIHFPFSAIQNVIPFYPNPDHYRNIYWLHYAIKDLISFNDYKGHWPEYMGKKVVVPTIQVTEDFGSHIKPNILLVFKLQKKCKNLSKTRDLLLPKLISGELDVSELDITIPEANA